MQKRFASLLLAFALSASPLAAQTLTPAETAKVDSIVASALKSSGVPSASVAIVRDGRIVFAKAYGDQGPNLPATTADAQYQIASISKQFVGAAILLLQADGKLSLDDKVSKWVPGISGGDKMTIRQLLSHTSGLQDYWPQDYSFAAMEKPVAPQGIVDRWAKKPLDFDPGTQWQYSNTGYVVAGMIVERASGQKLIDFLEARIFKPLGMHAIDQDLAIGNGFPQATHRFALGPVRPAPPAAHGWLYSAGELAMTASDLARWDIARIDRSILTPVDWEAQETPVILTDGRSSNYGLGVFSSDRNGRHIISHSGEAVGFLSENDVFVKERTAIVVLVNADFGDTTTDIERGIERVLFPPPALIADEAVETARNDLAKRIYASLQQGQIDRSLFTDNANYYFTAQAIGDYQSSLAPLGAPHGITPLGGPRLRGGFVNRNYEIDYPDRKLTLVTYAEPGRNGKLEQFIVMPGD